ncbi:MAG TPA: hypothetical protein VHC47_03180 [Mucilaginibacter sp.]|nr:hypothetical protein [Mucilaginibacter sp.]
MMKNDLDLVIDAFETEKKALQRMIKQSAWEHDHLIAYHHSEALLRLNRHLHILYSFRDPFHNERQELNRQGKFLRNKPKDIKHRLWKFVVETHSKEIEERKLELEAKQKKNSFNDTQEIDDLLFAIAEGSIKTFKIIVPLYDDAELQFTREGALLLICINLYEPYEEDFILDNRIPDPLKGLGFEFNADKRSYVYQCNLTNFKDATDIKILLSRLFFDVFNGYDVRQSATLKYHEDDPKRGA